MFSETIEMVRALATPLAVLGAGVGHALVWYKLSIRKTAKEEHDNTDFSTWRIDHQREADARDNLLSKLQLLITEVKATNDGQARRIEMLENEARDTRRANAPRGRLT